MSKKEFEALVDRIGFVHAESSFVNEERLRVMMNEVWCEIEKAYGLHETITYDQRVYLFELLNGEDGIAYEKYFRDTMTLD